jgi:hypothetical protein
MLIEDDHNAQSSSIKKRSQFSLIGIIRNIKVIPRAIYTNQTS